MTIFYAPKSIFSIKYSLDAFSTFVLLERELIVYHRDWRFKKIITVWGEVKDYKLNGEFKEFHYNGSPKIFCFYKEGEYHGEYKEFGKDGNVIRNLVFFDGECCNISDLSSEDKLLLTIKHNLRWLP